MQNYTLIHSEIGSYIKIVGEIDNSKDLKNYMVSQNISHIVLSNNVTDINFLKDISEKVKKLICVYKLKCDYTVLQHLSELEHLYIEDFNNQKINFQANKKIEYLNIKWNKNLEGLHHLTSLVHLELRKTELLNIDSTSLPLQLQKLDLINGKLTTLKGIDKLMNLKYVGLYYLKNLTELDDLKYCIKIQEIIIENCSSIKRVRGLERLTNLKKLVLENCGEIETLQPISQLNSLEYLKILGKTKILERDFDFAYKIKSKYIVGVKF